MAGCPSVLTQSRCQGVVRRFLMEGRPLVVSHMARAACVSEWSIKHYCQAHGHPLSDGRHPTQVERAERRKRAEERRAEDARDVQLATAAEILRARRAQPPPKGPPTLADEVQHALAREHRLSRWAARLRAELAADPDLPLRLVESVAVRLTAPGGQRRLGLTQSGADISYVQINHRRIRAFWRERRVGA